MKYFKIKQEKKLQNKQNVYFRLKTEIDIVVLFKSTF